MEAYQVWKLFEKTGNIGVYILYKKLSNEYDLKAAGDENKVNAVSNGRNSNKGN